MSAEREAIASALNDGGSGVADPSSAIASDESEDVASDIERLIVSAKSGSKGNKTASSTSKRLKMKL